MTQIKPCYIMLFGKDYLTKLLKCHIKGKKGNMITELKYLY